VEDEDDDDNEAVTSDGDEELLDSEESFGDGASIGAGSLTGSATGSSGGVAGGSSSRGYAAAEGMGEEDDLFRSLLARAGFHLSYGDNPPLLLDPSQLQATLREKLLRDAGAVAAFLGGLGCTWTTRDQDQAPLPPRRGMPNRKASGGGKGRQQRQQQQQQQQQQQSGAVPEMPWMGPTTPA